MSDTLPSRMNLVVITPHELVVDEEVSEVALPALDGYVGILPGHRNLILALGKGVLSFKKDRGGNEVEIQGGYAKIVADSVHVFTELGGHENKSADKG